MAGLVTLTALLLAIASPIDSDEVVVFFPTYGHLDKDGATWTVRIHGWIHEPEKDSATRRKLVKEFGRVLGFSEEEIESATFKQRAHPFFVDNERAHKISVRLGTKTYELNESEANGHFTGTLRVPAAEAKEMLLPFQAVMQKGDRRVFHGQVQLIGETGWSVISDIDDTIKISEVRDRKALIANTFLRDFKAVPGMADVYQGWAKEGAVFHYVSASPWQLYTPLGDFLRKDAFPQGTFHMKLFRIKDVSFFNLFGSQEEYKRQTIEPILKTFPKRKFVLVGDSGEQDPEIYAALAREYPRQVARILIRDTTSEEGSAERYKKAFEGLPKERWKVFRDAKEIGPLKKEVGD